MPKRTVHDDIREIVENSEYDIGQSKSLIRKITYSLVGIFLLLLALSITLPLERIGSLALSSTLDDDNTITLKDGTWIKLKENIIKDLQSMFATNNVEFKVCLKGEKLGDTYDISAYYIPKIYGSSFRHVTSEGCDPATLISLHSHPSMFCIFSRQDLKSYERLKAGNRGAMIGIMCGSDRFNFFGY